MTSHKSFSIFREIKFDSVGAIIVVATIVLRDTMKLLNVLLLISLGFSAGFHSPKPIGSFVAVGKSSIPSALRMSEEGKEEKKVVVSKDGTFYDDEVRSLFPAIRL